MTSVALRGPTYPTIPHIALSSQSGNLKLKGRAPMAGAPAPAALCRLALALAVEQPPAYENSNANQADTDERQHPGLGHHARGARGAQALVLRDPGDVHGEHGQQRTRAASRDGQRRRTGLTAIVRYRQERPDGVLG